MKPTPGMQKTFWEYHNAFEHRLFAWKHEVLFTWQWWLGIFMTIIPWIVWIMVRSRKATGRLLFAGTFVSLISLTFDNIGVQISLWNYPRPVAPAIPSYVPYDFSLMPVNIMILIQFFHNKSPWIIGLLFGLVTVIIGEPLFKKIGVYEPENWEPLYSLPIYGLIYVLAYKIAKSKKFGEF